MRCAHGHGRIDSEVGVIGEVSVVEECSGQRSGARPIETRSLSTSPCSSQYSVARPPEARQRRICDTPAGRVIHSDLLPLVASFMKPAHAGTATTLANPRRMIGSG